MSYNPVYEASKVLPVEKITEKLEDFAAGGQNLSKRRFSRSPPRVSSVPSTEYYETEPPSPNELLQNQEFEDLQNSTEWRQFSIQTQDELDRIEVAIDKGLIQQPNFADSREAAEANVKYRWIKQGIWDERWDTQPGRIWKHEIPSAFQQQQRSRLAKDAEVSDLGALENGTHKNAISQEALRSAIEIHNQDSSRPCYQFVHQFCEERQWIKMGLGEESYSQEVNLDARAYENVKSRWNRDGLWDDDWTFIPGVWWRHERPSRYPLHQESFRKLEAEKAARLEQAERPRDWYFMAPMEPAATRNRGFGTSVYPEHASYPSGLDRLRASSDQNLGHRDSFAESQNLTDVRPLSSMGQKLENLETEAQCKATSAHPPNVTPNRSLINAKKIRSNGRSSPRQNTKTPPSRIAGPMAIKKGAPTNKEKRQSSTKVKEKQPRTNGLTTSRPRRAAALEAMDKLTKAGCR